MKKIKETFLQKSAYRYLLLFFSLIVLYLLSGLFVVNIGEKVFITKMGRVEDKNTNPYYTPGLYWKLPYPFEKLYRFDTGFLHQLPLGFDNLPRYYRYLDSTKMKYLGWETIHNMEGLKNKESSLIISGDENIIDFRGICNYYIKDPVKFTIKVSKPLVLMKKIIEAEISLQSGKQNINDILLFKDSEFIDTIRNRVIEKFKKLDFGVEIQSLSVFDIHPPVKIVEAFRGVANARELKQKKIYNAMQYYNQVLPQARGEKAALISNSEATAYRKQIDMQGEAIRIQKTAYQYWKNPKLHRMVKYFRRMEKLLQDKKLYLIQGGKSKTLDFRFYK